MKTIKNIFARIWAIWGLFSFLATFLIIYPISLLSLLISNEKKSMTFFMLISRVWMRVWLFLIGCSLKIKGLDNFKKGENYIIVFNHNALLDIPLSSPFVPAANKTIAKSSFAKIPLFGTFYKKGSILVDRKNEKSRIKSYENMKKVLENNMHMCIYPEGTRNRTHQDLKPFYDGAFKLAIETGKDILPCIITGTKIAMPINKNFYLLPTKLSMEFLHPVSSDNINTKDLNKKVFEMMLSKIKMNYKS